MADMTQPLATFDGKGAKQAAEGAADELRARAQALGYDVTVRTVKSEAHMRGGHYVTHAVWGVFLAPPPAERRSKTREASG
ncbi:hypothetical protein [Streptomyces sp. NPDC049887]|uniref:hypothetical protein n=1 Tax=Streptomyces sp. NPDC049887 TaxID=3155654 RepID=UPI00341D2657